MVQSAFFTEKESCEQQTTPDLTLRLYALCRGDLEMGPGKLASQAGHAFVEALHVASHLTPQAANEYLSDPPGTKVVLRATSLSALTRAHDEARALGIPCSLITDSGHVLLPAFDGSPVVTALGLGPATRDQVRSITKRFQLWT